MKKQSVAAFGTVTILAVVLLGSRDDNPAKVPPALKYCWAATAQAPPGTPGSIATDEKSPNRVWLVVPPAA